MLFSKLGYQIISLYKQTLNPFDDDATLQFKYFERNFAPRNHFVLNGYVSKIGFD
jgi:hypothetical protein